MASRPGARRKSGSVNPSNLPSGDFLSAEPGQGQGIADAATALNLGADPRFGTFKEVVGTSSGVATPNADFNPLSPSFFARVEEQLNQPRAKPFDWSEYLAGLGNMAGYAIMSRGGIGAPGAGVNSARTPFRGRVFHGSDAENLTTISSSPTARQYDNASSVFGAFTSSNKAEAARYGKNLYEADVVLQNPKRMSTSEFYGKYQRPEVSADGARLPPEKWAARLEELKAEAARDKQQMISAGHDGIVVTNRAGEAVEVVSFGDIPLQPRAR